MKTAFTMIELVFVIVILGILAAIAIPKLSGIQEEALISKEKSEIANIRVEVLAIYARSSLRYPRDFNVSIDLENEPNYYITINQGSRPSYPRGLSTAGHAITTNAVEHDDRTLSLVMGASTTRDTWKCSGDKGGLYEFVGQASETIVDDGTHDIHTNTHWEYNSTTGQIYLVNSAYQP